MIKELHIAGARKASMIIARTLLTLLVALSVAAMPLGGASAMVAPATKSSVSEVVSVDAAHDCCPNADEKMVNDCGSLPGCAVKCFGGLGFAISSAPLPEAFAVDESLPVYEVVYAHTYGPPLRPPQT